MGSVLTFGSNDLVVLKLVLVLQSSVILTPFLTSLNARSHICTYYLATY